uniref:Uncharacterized protein n=1 Tax=Vitrella brassicaformis TaxID=1169539 RepID=A0A7S1JLM8_9ALVE|mmetsp:Transcript_14530/g.34668  ORF Transcript_14530/g.34668 Transcript_14530/m.34668 type:complete len:104 (+) Transcript_14530:397-708(+)
MKTIQKYQRSSQASFIFEAVRTDDVQSVNRLIEMHGIKVLDRRDNNENTPFICAAREGRVGIMSVCYDRYGPSILQQTKDNGWTALHLAAENGHSAAVSQLLK